MGLGSCEEADTLLSTGRQAGKLPGVEIRLAALRPHHVAAASPPPPAWAVCLSPQRPLLACSPRSSLWAAPYPTFLRCDLQQGSRPLDVHRESKVHLGSRKSRLRKGCGEPGFPRQSSLGFLGP